MAEGVKYIKVAKIDKNGVNQTLSLQSLSVLTIPYSTGNITYEILDISEQPNYFLYSVDNPNIEHGDRALLEYDFSSSVDLVNPAYQCGPSSTILDIPISLENIASDNLNFYNSTLEKYIINTYTQKNTTVEFSGSLLVRYPAALGFNTFVDHSIQLQRNNGDFVTLPNSTLKQNTINNVTAFTSSFHLSMSYGESSSSDVESLPGDQIYLQFNKLQQPGSGTSQFTASFASDVFFRITSSVASGLTMNTVPEPSFTQNFNRAFDCQPTLNNAVNNRLSSIYQDVDYSTNLMTPINFDVIISGSALKAEVQDSNYTSKRHILPRYEGSKSTSQFLNIFTRGDKGTYGTAPTAENLKTLVAYSGWTGGYLPEHNNAFGAHLKYLIKSNGDVVIPGSTPNALTDNENIFITGEFVEISSEVQTSNGEPGEFRKVLRGGKRITPILTNQHSHSPAAFSASLEMVNKDGVEIGDVTNDFNGSFNNNSFLSPQTLTKSGSFTNFQAPRVESSGSSCNVFDSKLVISQSMIDQGISLTLEGSLGFGINPNHADEVEAYAQIINLTTDEVLIQKGANGTGKFNIDGDDNTAKITLSTVINNTDMIVGHEYGIQAASIVNDIDGGYLQFSYSVGISRGSTFKVTQNPIPGTEVPTAGLWTSGSLADCSWPYTIISTNSTLVNFYDNNNAKQENNVGSGFFDFQNYWGLLPGDEFRFEAREDRVYTVKEAYVSSSRLFIEVDKALPLSGSVTIPNIGISGSINYSNFLIRRYVDDHSGLILEGKKPSGDGPYIIKPQYVNQELNENLPTYIETLKEKGLI